MDHEQEFSDYVRGRGPTLMRAALHLSGGVVADAEDMLQTALARTYVRWGRLERQGSIDAYVRKIMVRLSYRRSPAGRQRPLAEDIASLAPSVDVQVSDRTVLMGALRELPARQRTVLVLRYYDDMSEAEIADTIGCSRGTVKTHASRGLRALEASLCDPEVFTTSRSKR